MKKLIIGVAALSLLGAGAASAQEHHGGGGGGGGAAHSSGGHPSGGAGPRAGGGQFQGGGQFRGGDPRFQGGGQNFRGDPRFQGGQFRGQFNGGRGMAGDFRSWRGGRGPWVNDRNWFRNNWRIGAPGRFRGGFYNWPRGWYGYRHWYYGAILPSYFLLNDYILNSWWDYGLYEPPYGYEWVRVGPDVLLVDPYSGRVVQVVSDMFY